MRNTIYASFSEPRLAERAAGALLDHGVDSHDLSIIVSMRETVPAAEDVMPFEVPPAIYVTPNVGGVPTGFSPFGVSPMIAIGEAEDQRLGHEEEIEHPERDAKHGISRTTRQDAEAGALKGTAWGAGIGTVAALASLFIPGIGLVAGGGALATAIAGLAASTGAGAAAGAVTGYLKDQGVEGHVADTYERTVKDGGAVLALTLPSGKVQENKAWEILDKYSGRNVTSYAAKPYLG